MSRNTYFALYDEMASDNVADWDKSAYSSPQYFLYLLRRHVVTGAFCHPKYGGNAGANIGDVEAAFASSAKVIDAEYYFPLLSHAPLEPMNSTAWFKDGKIEIWSPSQTPGLANAAVPAGVQTTDVTFHLVRAGGGPRCMTLPVLRDDPWA